MITRAFTDGSCVNNGKPTAKGGFAFIIADGLFKGLQLCGTLPPSPTPTNIRAEGIAIIQVLSLYSKHINNDNWSILEIYTDSKFWIDMLTEYLPTWSDATRKTKSNPDLTERMWKLYQEINSKKTINLIHVYSHNKTGLRNSTDDRDKFMYEHNDAVDKLASSIINKT